jgi:catechol 2,3-dioxygenase-like lactoylglutathione lyase family enzyme
MTEKNKTLDILDHVAIQVSDLKATLSWYQENFSCTVEYEDDTWALLAFENIKLAFVIPSQHPPHLALISPKAEEFGPLKTHRDGTRSIYIDDPSGNKVEIMAVERVAV